MLNPLSIIVKCPIQTKSQSGSTTLLLHTGAKNERRNSVAEEISESDPENSLSIICLEGFWHLKARNELTYALIDQEPRFAFLCCTIKVQTDLL